MKKAINQKTTKKVLMNQEKTKARNRMKMEMLMMT